MMTGLVVGGSVKGLVVGGSVKGLVVGVSVSHELTSVHVPVGQQSDPSHAPGSGQSSPHHPITLLQILRETYPSISGQVYLIHGSLIIGGALIIVVVSGAAKSGATVGTNGASVGEGWSCCDRQSRATNDIWSERTNKNVYMDHIMPSTTSKRYSTHGVLSIDGR